MANDGLDQLMKRGVIVSGIDKEPVPLGTAEGVSAFAAWLERTGANGTVSFRALAEEFCREHVWQIEDVAYERRVRIPAVLTRLPDTDPATAPVETPPEIEPPDLTSTMGVRPSPWGAVEITPDGPVPIGKDE